MSCRCFFADPPNCSQITLWNKIEAPAKWWCDSPGRGGKPAKIQCYINNIPHKTKQTKTAICQIIYTILRPGSVVNEWCVFSATQWNFRIFTSNLQDHQNGGIHPFYGSFNVTKVIKKGIRGIWGNRLLPHARGAPIHFTEFQTISTGWVHISTSMNKLWLRALRREFVLISFRIMWCTENRMNYMYCIYSYMFCILLNKYIIYI